MAIPFTDEWKKERENKMLRRAADLSIWAPGSTGDAMASAAVAMAPKGERFSAGAHTTAGYLLGGLAGGALGAAGGAALGKGFRKLVGGPVKPWKGAIISTKKDTPVVVGGLAGAALGFDRLSTEGGVAGYNHWRSKQSSVPHNTIDHAAGNTMATEKQAFDIPIVSDWKRERDHDALRAYHTGGSLVGAGSLAMGLRARQLAWPGDATKAQIYTHGGGLIGGGLGATAGGIAGGALGALHPASRGKGLGQLIPVATSAVGGAAGLLAGERAGGLKGYDMYKNSSARDTPAEAAYKLAFFSTLGKAFGGVQKGVGTVRQSFKNLGAAGSEAVKSKMLRDDARITDVFDKARTKLDDQWGEAQLNYAKGTPQYDVAKDHFANKSRQHDKLRSMFVSDENVGRSAQQLHRRADAAYGVAKENLGKSKAAIGTLGAAGATGLAGGAYAMGDADTTSNKLKRMSNKALGTEFKTTSRLGNFLGY